MKNLPPSYHPRRDQGVALVLVLCFVVLITGLVVAYFSRTLTTRQLANASTSTTQAEMLANSATDVILGDLKQEIADPTASTASTPPPAALPAGSTVYVPTKAIYAVPQRNASPTATPATSPAPMVGPIPNLVRRSLRADSTAGGTNYVPSPGLTSRASAANSTTPSLNGRFVSAARWNRHYLIPTVASTGATASLTASTPVADFTAPDWVFVTSEKGPDVLSSPFKDAGGNTVTPTGRYAYAIYDEGGLLDINHTGYPSVSTLSHIGAKPAPSYADLTQLGLSAANVDSLLAWRNYATLQPTGTFPNLQPSASLADTAYYNLFAANPASFLQVPLTLWNSKTDQMFLSRQQLIGYFADAGLDPKYLQYLGTFSRSLNQPSYVPESTRPPVLATTAGGNDANGNTGITPNFLTARVVNAFTRYDGTTAVIGEPLLKKRFPLNRLAWLTYQGPSAGRNLTDPDVAQLLANGITADFLKQGTEDHIETYFGLQWYQNKYWRYIHGSNVGNGAILNISNPLKTTDVARLNPVGREPDFFELLKAAINPGSLAKASLAPSILDNTTHNPSYVHAAQTQYNTDISLDAAILQIGANIIDQFDTDGFPTRIDYDLAGSGNYSSVYGDENLPYISRVRAGLIRVVEANPPETAGPGTQPIINTGVGVLMNYPEIWNPHDWSATALQQSVGFVAPSNFEVYATTNGVQQSTTVYAWDTFNSPNRSSYDADWDSTPTKSPGFHSMYGFSFGVPDPIAKGGETRLLSEGNTRMTFTIDPTSTASEALFREPTILYTPGVPTGSSLASPALVSTNSGLGLLAANPSFFCTLPGGGLLSAVTGTVGSPPIPTYGTPTKGPAYIGFYIGAHPLRWWDDKATPQNNSAAYQTQYGPVNDVTYTLAYEDSSGAWIPYDTKSVTTTGGPNVNLNLGVDSGFGLNGSVGPGQTLDYGTRYYETVDPRSSRFGMMDPWIQSNANSIPPRQGYSYIDQTQGTLNTTRAKANSGTAFYFFPFTGGNYGANDWYSSSMGWYHDSNLSDDNSFRPGLLSQNNPNVTPDGMVGFTAAPLDGSNTPGTFPPFYYADPDGVVRRASGGNVTGGNSAPASTTNGLPMAYANATGTYGAAYSSGTIARQIDSRPVILNRPFRSVAELGYVYSGTPWKNLDFFLPESGDAAMLDVFCINDNSDSNALTAGQMNLNTHQVPVLQAILAQANKDLWNDKSSTAGTAPTTILGGAGLQAQQIAQLLVTRTAVGVTSPPNANNGPQPLQNVSDLVGRWVKEVDLTGAGGSNASSGNAGINGQASCDGFAADLANYLANYDLTNSPSTPDPMHNIQRFTESAVRALSNAGQTRVWNLMFDIVAQTGRYTTQATTLDQFNVEGEQHYWVHVAIDRYTGQVLDKQVEVIKE